MAVAAVVVKQTVIKNYVRLTFSVLTMCCENQWLETLFHVTVTLCPNNLYGVSCYNLVSGTSFFF